MQEFRILLPIICLAIGACTTGGGDSPVDNTFSDLENTSTSDALSSLATDGTATENEVAVTQPPNDAVQDPRAYCPKTVMRAGTETYNVYPDGMKSDDPDKSKKLRFRATITRVARECNYAGEFINIKVGAAGRALSGPTGETGQFTMPIRIAVTKGDEVLYSNLKDVPMEIPPGRRNGNFSYVDSAITIPKPEFKNVIIYIGYDEQRTDKPGQKDKQKRIN
ncbi:MAG: hypothetical protein ACR2O0_11295 [Rhizobiaceae bacterium]